jgi:hypothetical protein
MRRAQSAPRFLRRREQPGEQSEQEGNALEETQITPHVSPGADSGLQHQIVQKLRVVLNELAECRRLLETALSA